MFRRSITVSLYLITTIAVAAVAPVLFVLTWLLSFIPACRGLPHTAAMVFGYLCCEVAGICASGYLWLRYRTHPDYLEYTYRLQCWWANALKQIATRLYRLNFHLSGTAALQGNGAIMIARHTSIADTIIPMAFYAIPQRIRLRYVLKKELLLDPCLDIVGNRLPNYFVDRGGQDSDRAIAGISALASSLGPQDGLLFYPEGTRFSTRKCETLRARWHDRPELLNQLSRWRNLLPPRLGGTLALLRANPGCDLLFCAHSGFEESSNIRRLIDGSWLDAQIRVHFWRVPFKDIPVDEAGRQQFIFDQWDRMAHWVNEQGNGNLPS